MVKGEEGSQRLHCIASLTVLWPKHLLL